MRSSRIPSTRSAPTTDTGMIQTRGLIPPVLSHSVHRKYREALIGNVQMYVCMYVNTHWNVRSSCSTACMGTATIMLYIII